MFKVVLCAHGNIDYGQDPYEMICPLVVMAKHSIEECCEAVDRFLETNFFVGGSSWSGGQVLDAATSEPVAYISFNGRVWDKDSKYMEVGFKSFEGLEPVLAETLWGKWRKVKR